jgi:protein TonB
VRWFAWSYSGVVHAALAAGLLYMVAAGRPLQEESPLAESLPPLPAPRAPQIPLPPDALAIDEREELSEHGDLPVPEGYEYRPETDRWELILKDPRRKVTPDTAAAVPAANTVPRGQAGVLTPPRVTHQPRPPATPGAAGRVVLRIQVLMNGGVGEVAVTASSGDARLDRAAIAAVQGWKFLPATLNGLPVATWVEVPIRFTR